MLYKEKYQLLAADGSSFTFTRNSSDPDSHFTPDGKTANGYNQVHVIPLFDILLKRYTDCVVQPIRKKNEFRALCTLVDRHNPLPDSVPLLIADRGFHALNVFAHVIERHGFFLIRATDVKMQRSLKKIFQKHRMAALISRSPESLPAAIQRKNTSIRNYLISRSLCAKMLPSIISILITGLNTRSPCVYSGLIYQKTAMKISSPISLQMNSLWKK